MNSLVKFIMIENNIEIPDNESYLRSLIEKLIGDGIITRDNYTFEAVDVSEKVEVDNNFLWTLEFNINSINFQVVFLFETYNDIMQLSVEIQSNINLDELPSQKTELEILKINLKNNLFNRNRKTKLCDWKKCIWLYDAESQMYSSNLYPQIYKTENLFRQLINEVMNRIFGANWWETLAPITLKDKRNYRVSSYKSTVPSLNDVEENLLVIDVTDLLKIVQLKIQKWNPMYNDKINQMLNNKLQANEKEVYSILKSQCTTEIDIWEKYFSQYLSEDFLNNFDKFQLNRNHIAHNKFLDRQAFENIAKSSKLVYDDIANALNTFSSQYIPQEIKELNKLEKEYDEEEYTTAYEELMEYESGVEIRDDTEIYELYEDAFKEFYYNIQEALRFREDIEVSGYHGLVFSEDKQDLFTVKYRINNTIATISCDGNIDTSPGATSIINILLYINEKEYKFSIPYINGEASFNEEQCNYMPEIEDEFGYAELEDAQYQIIDYVNENFENLREKIDAIQYNITQNGGRKPIADCPCCECGEEYICVDDTISEYGQCLNCGTINEILECEKCGHYFDLYTFDSEDDAQILCENCKK